jgi:hypothetical protein
MTKDNLAPLKANKLIMSFAKELANLNTYGYIDYLNTIKTQRKIRSILRKAIEEKLKSLES